LGKIAGQHEPIRVGIVQPNLPQNLKWKPENLYPTLTLMRQETCSLAQNGLDLVVWPETAVPHRDPLNTPFIGNFVKDCAKMTGLMLVTGLVEWENRKPYNSAVLIEKKGNITDRYRKIHLVPLAEYLPFEFLRKYKIFDQTGLFDQGKEETVFKTPFGNFSTLICFESYFDYLARRMVNKGAEFLMVLTNDAWYQNTNEAKCHFIMGIFRSVENHRWLIQCSNTGVSGIVNPWGKVIKETKLFEKTSFKEEVYKSQHITVYTTLGNWFPVLCLILAIAAMVKFCPIGKKNEYRDTRTEDAINM
jgi:apolipoprotein N-acyltransferase